MGAKADVSIPTAEFICPDNFLVRWLMPEHIVWRKNIRFFVTIFAALAMSVASVSAWASSKEDSQDSASEKQLDLLSSWLVGSWDNIAQVEGEIKAGVPPEQRRQRYAMRYTEIKAPAIKGRIFAIENYDDGNGFKGSLQRISLHRFMLSDDKSAILHEILFLKDKAFRKSLIGNLKPLENITEDDIRSRADCRLYWAYADDRFEGATKKGACVTNSYTDRDITVEGMGQLDADHLVRHDRNFEMSGEEIPRAGYKIADKFDRVSSYTGAYIRRPTLVVHDMEGALRLYRDILGLKLGRLGQDDPESYVYTTFNIPKRTPVMHATMDTDKGGRVLSLVEVKSMIVPNSKNMLRTSAIMINANGRLDEIRKRLIKDGFTVYPNHKLGRTGTEFAFIDADGHLIALYEFPGS